MLTTHNTATCHHTPMTFLCFVVFGHAKETKNTLQVARLDTNSSTNICSPANVVLPLQHNSIMTMNEEFRMLAKTFKGLEEVLAGELIEIGANNVQIERRAVSFYGDKRTLYTANMCLRTASRVLVPVATFKAADADEVYNQVKQVAWDKYMTSKTTFAIDATVYSNTFRHSQYVTYRVKDAIADWWVQHENKRPNVKLTEPDLYINVHIAETLVTLSLDSSGISLHKRGYRVANTEAPINEALAAGLLLLAGWKGQSDFYDMMCGSGTLLIEAALIARNIAPGIYRKGFAFEKWIDFDRELFEEIYNDDSRERPFTHHIYGSDAGYYAVQAARKNIQSASMQHDIDVRQIRLEEIHRDENHSTQDALVIMNPPYGERLAQNKDILRLYQDIGTTLKHQFSGATAWIISSNEEALKCIGLKPSQRIHLINGEIECLYNKYELFQGEHKEWKKDHPKTTNTTIQTGHKPTGRRPDRKPNDKRPDNRFARTNSKPTKRPIHKDNNRHATRTH